MKLCNIYTRMENLIILFLINFALIIILGFIFDCINGDES